MSLDEYIHVTKMIEPIGDWKYNLNLPKRSGDEVGLTVCMTEESAMILFATLKRALDMEDEE